MLEPYDGKMIRITDRWGHVFTGEAYTHSQAYMFHEYGWDEEGVLISGWLVRAGDIVKIEECPNLAILRMAGSWQQAEDFYAHIRAEQKESHIPWQQKSEGHDAPDTKYIVVTDRDDPIAAARMYPLDTERMMIDRLAVLPEYRQQGIGTLAVSECEAWAEELYFSKTVLESPEESAGFFEQMRYEICGEELEGDTAHGIRLEKEL